MPMIQFDEDKQKRKIDLLLRKEEEELVQALSDKYNLPYIDLSSIAVNTDALRYIDEKDAREAKAAAFAIVNKKLSVAVRDPSRQNWPRCLENLKGKGLEPDLFMASTASLEKAWALYKELSFASETKSGSLEISSDEIEAIVKEAKDLATVVSILANTVSLKKSYRVSRILETCHRRRSGCRRFRHTHRTGRNLRPLALSPRRRSIGDNQIRRRHVQSAFVPHQTVVWNEIEFEKAIAGWPIQHPCQ